MPPPVGGCGQKCGDQSMIPKRECRFSEEIVLKQNDVQARRRS
jgi:hypothetical protein